MLDEWRFNEIGLWPEIGGKESIGLLQTLEDGSAEVFSGSGLTYTGSVNIIDTGEVKDLLGNLGSDVTSSSWGWDHSDDTRTALSLNLDWDGMDVTNDGTPITSSNWDDVDLGIEESTLDSNLDLLGDLDTNTTVTSFVTSGDNSLESGSLTGLGLLLYGQDAHDFIMKGIWANKLINDLCFLDGDGVSVDLLKGFDVSTVFVSIFHKSSQLGQWSPFFLESTSSTWSSSSTSATSATSAATEASSSIASASTATSIAASAAATFSRWLWLCTVHF